MTKYRLLGLLFLIVFVGLVVFSLQSAKDVSVQVPISSKVSSQDESISMESSSIIESSSVTESVQDESIEMSENIGESSSQESELKTSLSEKEKEDTSLSENDWKEQQDRYDKLEYYLKEQLDDTQYSSMRFLSENYPQSQTLEIWATDSEAVRQKLKKYAKIENISDLSISIQPARYSRKVLLSIRDAISKFADEQYEENEPFLINYSRVLKDFVYISVPEKTEELNNFLEENDFKDYVEIEVAIMIVPYA